MENYWPPKMKINMNIYTSVIALILLSLLLLASVFLKLIVLRLSILFFIVAFTIIILSFYVNSQKTKYSMYFIRSISVLFISVILILISSFEFIRIAIPYLYSPPALTTKNLHVYKQCISFLQMHNEYKSLRFTKLGYVSIEDYTQDELNVRFFFFNSIYLDSNKTKLLFSNDDVAEIKKLANAISDIGCLLVHRTNEVVLFPNSKGLFYPARPGVVFSLNGENPNEINSRILNLFKPFTKISGNWYLSKKLFVPIYRLPFGDVFPAKSLFDYSVQTKGLNLDLMEEQ